MIEKMIVSRKITESHPTKRLLIIVLALAVIVLPAYPQNADKLIVIAAPGVTKSEPKDWRNSLGISGEDLVLNCPKCVPIQTVKVPSSDIATIRYGENAYHHWVAGIVTGVLSLGVGLIVGLMPHHQHYFSVDTKEGKVVAIQADKKNYRNIAGMLQNFTGLPIQVSAKEAHFLNGFNVKITSEEQK